MHYLSLQGPVTRRLVGYDVYHRQCLTWTLLSNVMAIHHGVHRYLVWLSQITYTQPELCGLLRQELHTQKKLVLEQLYCHGSMAWHSDATAAVGSIPGLRFSNRPSLAAAGSNFIPTCT